jgi:glycosyltransferase involved in cell wall biosynthesis
MPTTTETVSRIAVVIPVYNGADYLQKSIDSALEQSFPAAEICIVDDASTDNSPDIIAGYAGNARIRSQRLPHRLPAPGAWNSAVRASSASHVVILAHDDMLEPDFCKAAQLAIGADPSLDILAFGRLNITSTGEALEAHPMSESGLPVGTVLEKDQFLDQFCSRGQMFLPSAVVVSRRIFDAVGGFDEQLKVAYDWDFYLRAAATGAVIKFHPDVLCRYRIHATQSVAAFTRRDNGDNSIIFEKLKDLQRSITPAQLKMLLDGMCDFMRQMVTRSLRDPQVSTAQLLSLRSEVRKTLEAWRDSPRGYASLVQILPNRFPKRIVWHLTGSRAGIAILRRILGVKARTS